MVGKNIGVISFHLCIAMSFRRLAVFVTLLAVPLLFLQNVPTSEAQNPPASQSSGTRCTTTGSTLFIRFDYQPVPGADYLPNKAMIYVPKEAQCAGTFPMYLHLHGDNGRDDISNFYLPCRLAPDAGGITTAPCRSPTGIVVTGGRKMTSHGADTNAVNVENGTGRFQSYIESAMSNSRVPGMVFVLPVNGHSPVNWTGVNAERIREAAQAALRTHPQTQNIVLGNDLLVSGHSGAGCRADASGLVQFASARPVAVGVLDTCTTIYKKVATTYPNATLLFYAADMAYTGATWDGTTEAGGYHNALKFNGTPSAPTTDFQNLTSCDPQIFFIPHDAAARARDSTPHYGISPGSARAEHFRHYWDEPLLGCAKSAAHPWYALFATETDHPTAAGLGVKTLLSLYYSQNRPQTTAPTTTNSAPPVNNQPVAPIQQPVSNTNPNVVVAPLAGTAIPLEVDIAGINAIAGNNQGYLINYTQILFTYATGIAGTLALIVMIGAGILIIIGGSGETITKAKQIIVGCISGLILLAVSGWILYLINPCFFNFGNGNACVARGPQAVHYTFTNSTNAPVNNGGTITHNPPPLPTAHCTADNICDVVLDVPFLSQGSAPKECTYAGICDTNPGAGDDREGKNHKWSGVSCGAAAFSSAYFYVSGITDRNQQRQFFSDFINNYYRCGIHNLPPNRDTRNASQDIRGYDATNAPYDVTYNLCAYVLGSGGNPNVMVTIFKTIFNARGTHSTPLTPAAIYQELSAGHPIVVAGVLALTREGGFRPEAHFTTLIGIQGYNAATQTFTNLVIHDVGRQASSIMSQANYNELRIPVRTRDGTMVPPLHGGVAVAM